MKFQRIKPEVEVHRGWTRWVKPTMRGYLMVCCDCGLHHWMDFAIHDDRVFFKAKRAAGYTRRERSKMHKRQNKGNNET